MIYKTLLILVLLFSPIFGYNEEIIKPDNTYLPNIDNSFSCLPDFVSGYDNDGNWICSPVNATNNYYNVTNLTVYNITNITIINQTTNITNNITNNITQNMTQSDIESLGFNITTDLKNYFDTLYYSISNTLNFVNISQVVADIGNWSADKPNYYNSTQIDQNISYLNNSINNETQNRITNDSLLLNNQSNAVFNNVTTNYINGQPIIGKLGSGIVYASQIDNTYATVAINCTGLVCSYPNMTIYLVRTNNTYKYCNISEGTFTLDDDTHNVVYVDYNCAIQKTSFQNYINTNLAPGGQADFFNAMAHSGVVEVDKGILIGNKVEIATRLLLYKTLNLQVVSGLDIFNGTFPAFTIGTGQYVFLRSVVDTTSKNTAINSIESIGHNSSSSWQFDSQTGLNITHCDNGTSVIPCSNTNKFRRHFIFLIGYNESVTTDSTEINQLYALDNVSYTTLASCLDTVATPLTYTLPTYYTNVAVMLYAYCAKGTDTSWSFSNFIDLRKVKTGSAGGGTDISTLVPYSGASNNVDLGTFNLTANTIFGFINSSYIQNPYWLNTTDQRYNDTALINTVNTSSNIKSLGFNLTTELKTYFDSLYYSITNPLNFVNTTYLLANYYNKSDIDFLVLLFQQADTIESENRISNDSALNDSINNESANRISNDTAINNSRFIYYCFQDLLNFSDCSNLTSGSFSFSGPVFYNETAVNDGKWNTNSSSNCGSSYFYKNYSVPLGAVNSSRVRIKVELNDSYYNIPSQCWNDNLLQLRYFQGIPCGIGTLQTDLTCYNSTDWTYIVNYGETGGRSLYEIGVNWTINLTNYVNDLVNYTVSNDTLQQIQINNLISNQTNTSNFINTTQFDNSTIVRNVSALAFSSSCPSGYNNIYFGTATNDGTARTNEAIFINTSLFSFANANRTDLLILNSSGGNISYAYLGSANYTLIKLNLSNATNYGYTICTNNSNQLSYLNTTLDLIKVVSFETYEGFSANTGLNSTNGFNNDCRAFSGSSSCYATTQTFRDSLGGAVYMASGGGGMTLLFNDSDHLYISWYMTSNLTDNTAVPAIFFATNITQVFALNWHTEVYAQAKTYGIQGSTSVTNGTNSLNTWSAVNSELNLTHNKITSIYNSTNQLITFNPIAVRNSKTSLSNFTIYNNGAGGTSAIFDNIIVANSDIRQYYNYTTFTFVKQNTTAYACVDINGKIYRSNTACV